MGRYSDSSDDAVSEYYQAQNWRKEGAKEERERIIKLLVEAKPIYHTAATDPPKFGSVTFHSDIIALIKGESQKDNKSVVALTDGETDA